MYELLINITSSRFATVVFDIYAFDENIMLNMTTRYNPLRPVNVKTSLHEDIDNTIFPSYNGLSSAYIDSTNKVLILLSFDFMTDMYNTKPSLMATPNHLYDEHGHLLHSYMDRGNNC